MTSQFKNEKFKDNEMPALENYNDEDVEYLPDGKSLIIWHALNIQIKEDDMVASKEKYLSYDKSY